LEKERADTMHYVNNANISPTKKQGGGREEKKKRAPRKMRKEK